MPKAYSLAPRRVSAGARVFFEIGTHIVLKTDSHDRGVLSFFSLFPLFLPPSLFFFLLLFLKPQKNGNRDPSSVAVSCSKKRGGEPGFVRPSASRRRRRVPKTRILCQEPSRVGRRRRGLRVGAQRPHRHPGPHDNKAQPSTG